MAEAKGISLHVSPTGTYEGTAGTPVKVTLALAGGDVHVVEVPGNHPALASRKSDSDDGTYRLGTIRLPLEDLREGAVIRSVMIEPNGHPIVVRSVDFWK